MRRFENKTAVITGAARGIGEAIARRFIREGGRALLADIDEDQLRKTAESIGEGAYPVFVDVRSSDSVAAMAKYASELFGQVDILFSNAGIMASSPFLETPEEQFCDVMNTNAKGMFLVGKAIAGLMVKTGVKGAIVNTCSSYCNIVSAGTASYSASKGAVLQLTKVMAVDLAQYGIRVNAFAPGFVDTRIAAKSLSDPNKVERLKSQWCIKRPSDPSEQAAVALFLASDDASYMTGEIVFADAGWHIV
ncbi:MAG: SDR family oxidoreductase [Oscillospiraceae bacterium]|nr:SDR family oxidoreductase [Oscillospiraceae bacterium]